MGTPEFALPSLQALHELTGLVAVVAQPDRPSGRGQRTVPPPVAQWAHAHGIELLQPSRLREPGVLAALAELRPAIVVVAAYGKILPRTLLELPPRGCINVHASLLPRYRGAAPVQWAIAQGEAVTGISLMRMEEGLDTGAVYVQESLAIDPQDTGGSLTARLAVLGGALLTRSLPALLDGTLRALPQAHAAATLAPKLTREDAVLDFSRAARELEARIRAFQPWPGAVALLPGETRLKILRARVEPARAGRAGEVIVGEAGQLLVACGEGALALEVVQPEGRRPMATVDFLSGHQLLPGVLLRWHGGRGDGP
jgi:methionyl-tRNA formyltransferase